MKISQNEEFHSLTYPITVYKNSTPLRSRSPGIAKVIRRWLSMVPGVFLVTACLAGFSHNASAALSILLGSGAGSLLISDDDVNDMNNTPGIVQFQQNVKDFTASGKLFQSKGGVAGAAIFRVVLTDLTVQANLNKNIAGESIVFGNTVQAIFPLQSLVHLSGRYDSGNNMIGAGDIALTGLADVNMVGDTNLGTVDPLAVMNAAKPKQFAYPAGTGATFKKNLNIQNPGITSFGGVLNFSLNSTDFFVLPNSAEVALAESLGPLDPVPLPSAVFLFASGLVGFLSATRKRRDTGNRGIKDTHRLPSEVALN